MHEAVLITRFLIFFLVFLSVAEASKGNSLFDVMQATERKVCIGCFTERERLRIDMLWQDVSNSDRTDLDMYVFSPDGIAGEKRTTHFYGNKLTKAEKQDNQGYGRYRCDDRGQGARSDDGCKTRGERFLVGSAVRTLPANSLLQPYCVAVHVFTGGPLPYRLRFKLSGTQVLDCKGKDFKDRTAAADTIEEDLSTKGDAFTFCAEDIRRWRKGQWSGAVSFHPLAQNAGSSRDLWAWTSTLDCTWKGP